MTVEVELLDQLSFLFQPKRFKGAKGGRGGAKSWGFARALLLIGHRESKRILCAREIQDSIKRSVYDLLVKQISKLGLDDASVHDMVYHWNNERIWHDNGTEIFFKGLWNNIDSIKSMEGIDICWIEEANTVSKDSWDKLIPTIRKPGSEIWFTYNPDSQYDEVHQRFVINQDPDCTIATVNWRDNPWMSDELLREMEKCRARNFKEYLWIWEGFTRDEAGETAFDLSWFETYHNPESIAGNCYILVDPANSKSKKSDYTAIIVMVAGVDENLYVLEIIRDRLIMEKFDIIFNLYQKYKKRFASVVVGYERYGMQLDIHHIKERQERVGVRFPIVELGGRMSKVDRILRLVEPMSNRKIWLPEKYDYRQLDGKVVDTIDLLKQELSIFHPVNGIPDAFHDDLSDCLSRICDAELRVTYPTKAKLFKGAIPRKQKLYDPATFGFE